MVSTRNRELVNLVLVGILGTAAFGSAWIARTNRVSAEGLVDVAVIAAVFLAAHVVVRFTVPHAEPTLLPLAALLTAIGLAVNYRLDPVDGKKQAIWVAIGVLAFAATLIAFRFDYRILEQYRYLFGISAIVLLLLPSAPGLGQRVNGVRLWIRVGGLQFQPGEIAKLFLDPLPRRATCARSGRCWPRGASRISARCSRSGAPRCSSSCRRAISAARSSTSVSSWAWSTSPPGRLTYVFGGGVLFLGGSAALYTALTRVQERVTIWAHPWTDHKVYCALNGQLDYRQNCQSYQLVKSLYSIAHGGFGGTGIGRETTTTLAGTPLIPELNTDFVYSAIAQGLGLIGAAGFVLRVHGARRARDAGRADRAGRLLEAPRDRSRIRSGAADVHHHRRRRPRRAADGDHAPVRLLRRLQHPGQLHRARPPPARLAPGPHHLGGAMNKQILRLSGVAMVLLAALIAATTYWQTWARADLAAKQDNAIQRVAQFSIRRGAIEAGGRLLAGNTRRFVDGRALYFRRYPLGPLTAHVVGYSTAARARTGLEKSLNDYLTASNESLSTLVDRSLDQLRGKPIRGNDVRLTLNLRAQQVALDALGTKCGAVVAFDPRNGAVKVLASAPSYDPNLVENHYSAIGRIKADCTPAAPLVNRATAGSLPARARRSRS